MLFAQDGVTTVLENLELLFLLSSVTLGLCFVVFQSDFPVTIEQKQKLSTLFKKVVYKEVQKQTESFYDPSSRLSLSELSQMVDENYIMVICNKFRVGAPEHFHKYLTWLTSTQCAGICIGLFGRDYRVKHIYDCSPWDLPITMRAFSIGFLRMVFSGVERYRGFIFERRMLIQMAHRNIYIPPFFQGFSAAIETTLNPQDIVLAVGSQM